MKPRAPNRRAIATANTMTACETIRSIWSEFSICWARISCSIRFHYGVIHFYDKNKQILLSLQSNQLLDYQNSKSGISCNLLFVYYCYIYCYFFKYFIYCWKAKSLNQLLYRSHHDRIFSPITRTPFKNVFLIQLQ